MSAPTEKSRGFTHSPWPQLSDPQWFALNWYGQTVAALCKRRGLRMVRPELPAVGLVSLLPGFRSGHVVAASPELFEREFAPADLVVVGGPCIGDCASAPTLEALYDTVQVLLAARALAAPAVLFIGDEEEALERGGKRTWIDLGERFERWLAGLAAGMGVEACRVVRTSGSVHADALVKSGRPAGATSPLRIDAAFHLALEPPRPQDENSRDVTCRVIEAHLPEVVGHHLGRETPPAVLTVENLQQSGVFEVARDLAAERGGQVVFAAHWPAPGLSAAERMFRSGDWDKIPAWRLEDVAAGRLPGLHPYTSEFFRCWVGPEDLATLSRVSREAW